ncbi:hypothetical protein SEA_HARAMBE_62 [Gordonia phage Harambe]|uniref:Uncharacterized protein n=6 Tax=Woesvirus woes TaxID=1982751 RepID=A0A2H4PG11_9CAUD|nr:hypothetical protein SEA_ANAMIKA_62 [Gordonia phage Anamika]AVP43246.1 hypothetical protein PBI_HAIL2PITT_61 [Gordonia phage Hail2Pitt]QAX94668.1 hypothetical protein SEA_HARAMBE_62 [Gordonia phage Harambe]QAX95331.1 hypothetical protein SEA_HELLO_62 [Gordonia phage Hello]QAX95423.1 hypothetical protein SEA_NEOEVIE_62 [Gordonia phage Neoevie]QDF16921.1 hypothetical protein SEA_TEAL_62 [Gordonia phage Teal]UVF60834.1 hypothetical protein SEA_STICKER17_62 [Gordonia phage Sticker17]UVK60300.
MSITIPQAPENVVWTGTEIFGDCRYVYVRFEDHSVSIAAPQSIRTMMLQLQQESMKRRTPEGNGGAYALLLNPWAAEQVYNYCNALMFGVTRAGVNMEEVRSRHWKPIRTADQSAITPV